MPGDQATATSLSIKLLVFVDRRSTSREFVRTLRQQIQGFGGPISADIEVVEVRERPYLAEHYKLIATPALVKTYPNPAQVLAGQDMGAQLDAWWPRWLAQVQQALDEATEEDGSLAGPAQTAEILRLSDEVFKLRQQTAELEEQLMFKDRILAMLAHDLRNPLSAASLACETLEQKADLLSADLTQMMLAQARMQLKQMNNMIEDILEAAKGTSSELSIFTSEISLTDVCRRVLEDVAARASAKHLTIETDIPAVLPTIQADRDKIRQVLSNLLDNAIKYTPAEGTIRLTAFHRTSQKVEVIVSDTGPGIPPGAQEQVFSDTVRLSRDRDREGYGIGLSLCRRIIRSHYGRIWVDSSPGEGSSFHFTLPVFRV